MAKIKGVSETKVFVMELRDGGVRKVTVPGNWRVTFGPTVPFERKHTGGGMETWALRFYNGQNLQAIFTDVKCFRDESISVLERVTQVQRKAHQKHTPQGMKDVIVEARVTEWRNPDAPDPNEGENPFLLETESK